MSESIESVDTQAPTAPEANADVGTAEGKKKSIKHRRGKVVSAKMQGTVIVMVERKVKHRRYKKYVSVRQRYAVDDKMSCTEGDLVIIRETRPLSKTKRWEVARKIGHQD